MIFTTYTTSKGTTYAEFDASNDVEAVKLAQAHALALGMRADSADLPDAAYLAEMCVWFYDGAGSVCRVGAEISAEDAIEEAQSSETLWIYAPNRETAHNAMFRFRDGDLQQHPMVVPGAGIVISAVVALGVR